MYSFRIGWDVGSYKRIPPFFRSCRWPFRVLYMWRSDFRTTGNLLFFLRYLLSSWDLNLTALERLTRSVRLYVRQVSLHPSCFIFSGMPGLSLCDIQCSFWLFSITTFFFFCLPFCFCSACSRVQIPHQCRLICVTRCFLWTFKCATAMNIEMQSGLMHRLLIAMR